MSEADLCAALVDREPSAWTADPRMVFEGRRTGKTEPSRRMGPSELHTALSDDSLQCLYGPQHSEWTEVFGYGEFRDAAARESFLAWVTSQPGATREQQYDRDILSCSDSVNTYHFSVSESDIVYAFNGAWNGIIDL